MAPSEYSVPLRVTHVITRLIIGGAQENTASSVLGLHQKPELSVRLISGPTHGSEGSLEHLFAHHPGLLQVLPTLVRPVQPGKDLRALLHLTKTFQIERPHIVHTHSSKAGILGRLAAARARVPVIIHTIHGPSFGSFQDAVPNFFYRAAERFAARVTTHFVSVAQAMTEQYLAAAIGNPKQYSRIFSGFDLQPFLCATNDLALREKLRIARDEIVVGKIARLFELKGHDDLIDAAPDLLKSCPRLKFLFVGDGPWKQRLEQKIHSLGLESQFVFSGLLQPEQVPKYLGLMDILVHLSRREGLPRALPQALAAGKPVIAFDCDGAREICLENETGFLVPIGDRASFTSRLLQLANDPGLREQFGRRGREIVRKDFATQRMVDDLHALYLRLVSKSASEPKS